MPAAEPKLRLAIVGTGDVAYRHYLPALEPLADQVAITAFVDPRPGAAERAAASVAAWSPGAAPYTDLDAMLADGVAEAAIDLAPAPRHGSVNLAILEAGLHLYSEKPLGGQRRGGGSADRHGPTERGVRFLCAPGRRRDDPLPLAGRAHRLGALRPAHAGGDAPRRSRARPRGASTRATRHRSTAKAWARSSTTACIACTRSRCCSARSRGSRRWARSRRRPGWSVAARSPADDRGHDARPRPDQPAVRERGAGPAAGELRHARLARAMAGAAFPDGHAEFQRARATTKTIRSACTSMTTAPTAREDWQHGIEIPKDGFGIVEAGARHFIACLRDECRARPDGRARPPRPRGHARGVCLDRGRPLARDRHDLLSDRTAAQPSRAASRIAARERSMSSSVVDQFTIEIRIAAMPCHVVPGQPARAVGLDARDDLASPRIGVAAVRRVEPREDLVEDDVVEDLDPAGAQPIGHACRQPAAALHHLAHAVPAERPKRRVRREAPRPARILRHPAELVAFRRPVDDVGRTLAATARRRGRLGRARRRSRSHTAR